MDGKRRATESRERRQTGGWCVPETVRGESLEMGRRDGKQGRTLAGAPEDLNESGRKCTQSWEGHMKIRA